MKALLHRLLLLAVILWPPPSLGLDQVRLQLKWQHQFQFAGYYAAVEQGYYRDVGLEVKILPSQPGQDGVKEVLEGRAEFGVGTSELLLLREKGEPVVVLAAIFQHSPLALVSLKRHDIDTVQSLKGKRLMIEPGSAELFAYLRREGLGLDSAQLPPHSSQISDLLDGKVDAMSVYVTDEPFALVQAKKDYALFSPRAGGIDFYGDNLFTTEPQIRDHPDRVRAFRAASLKGWEYAMKHPEEIAQLIYGRYSNRHSLEHLRFEAARMEPLLQPQLIEIGHMYPGRWQHIASVYAELGMLPADFKLGGFLYDPHPPAMNPMLLYAALAGLALVVAAYAYVHRINLRLKGSEKRYQALFDTMPLALVVFDLEDRITAWNDHAAQIFGWTRHEALGQDLYQLLVPPEEAARVRKTVSRGLRERVVTHSINRNRTKPDKEITCEWYNTLYYGQDGRLAGGISLGADISQRMLNEDRLNQARRFAEKLLVEQRHFLAMVSHEMRSPLATLDSTAQLMSIHCLSHCGSNEIFRRLRQGLRRFTEFFDNFLTDDKLRELLETGQPLHREAVDLQALLAEVMETARQDFALHHLELKRPATPCLIAADRHLMLILLQNLISNACKFSPVGSSVGLTLTLEPEQDLSLSIQDQGLGIPPEEVEKVRQRYYRGPSGGGGTGLGLYLADQIVTLHGGKLDITSTPDLGTLVIVHLPTGE